MGLFKVCGHLLGKRNLTAVFFSLHCDPPYTSSLHCTRQCRPKEHSSSTVNHWTVDATGLPQKLNLLASLNPCPTHTPPKYNTVQWHTPREEMLRNGYVSRAEGRLGSPESQLKLTLSIWKWKAQPSRSSVSQEGSASLLGQAAPFGTGLPLSS